MHSIKRVQIPPLSRRTQPILTAATPFLPHQAQDHHTHFSTSKSRPIRLATHIPPPLRPHQTFPNQPHLSPRFRTFATNPPSPSTDQETPLPTPYTYQTLAPLTTSPSRNRLIIDVREPAELADTGRIPSAVSMPITSNPDAFYLDAEEFFERFGFEKPVASRSGKAGDGGIGGENPYTEQLKRREAGAGLNGGDDVEVGGEEQVPDPDGGGVEEVIFYCKAGVRSRAAARMAREWQGVKVGDMKGGWMEWSASGGKVER